MYLYNTITIGIPKLTEKLINILDYYISISNFIFNQINPKGFHERSLLHNLSIALF